MRACGEVLDRPDPIRDHAVLGVLITVECSVLEDRSLNGLPLTASAMQELIEALPGTPVFDGRGRSIQNYVGEVIGVWGHHVTVDFRRSHLAGHRIFLELIVEPNEMGEIISIKAVVAADLMVAEPAAPEEEE